MGEIVTGTNISETQICRLLNATISDLDVLSASASSVAGWAYFPGGEGFDAFLLSFDSDGNAIVIWGKGKIICPVTWESI